MHPILISILFVKLVNSNYLEARANFHRPKSERNNIVNKGVWVRNRIGENFEKTSLGNVIFREQIDGMQGVENGDNGMEEGAFIPNIDSSVPRSRRSSDLTLKRFSKKGLRPINSIQASEENDSKRVLPLTRKTVDNDLLKVTEVTVRTETTNNSKTDAITIGTTTDKVVDLFTTMIADISNYTQRTTDGNEAKRRSKHNLARENMNKEQTEEYYTKNNKSKPNRNVFDKDDLAWNQNLPIPDTHIYEVVPRDHEPPRKSITEKGLIKVIAMLTKTFKKIMKQHSEVKRIYEKLNGMNEDFMKQVNDLNLKFSDFDSKYSDMIQFNDKLKAFEEKIMAEEVSIKTQYKQMNTNLEEFENQQKKFVSQQKQFYTVQKVMLAQNEKINNKQLAIAKTQSEISYKQNSFSRILKKAKQMLVDKTPNEVEKVEVKTTTENIVSTTLPTTESAVKFNLFSIPTKTRLPYNQDDEIIKEKDERTVDDLVYKYYFNNTFIDNLMKSKILNDYATNTNGIEIARNAKNKREEYATTVLWPINNDNIDLNNNKIHKISRRWIAPNLDAAKKLNKKDTDPADPYRAMAISFCNEIGQNTNQNVLNYCVEKSMRRLKFMGNRIFSKNPVALTQKKQAKVTPSSTTMPISTVKPMRSSTVYPIVASTLVLSTNSLVPTSTQLYALPQGIFFPDNDELESNLKQFDLTPDTEGNVYYEGSLHLSDMNHGGHDSGGISDIMPGLVDSNSKVEMNPAAFDLQAKRRAFVNRMNDDIIKKIKSRKL